MQDTLPPANPPRKNRLLIVLIVAALVVLGLCAATFAVIFTQVGNVVTNEVPALQKNVDDFIRAGAKQDVAAGYALFSPEAQRQFGKSDIEKMYSETAVLFDQFQSTAVTNFNIKTDAATTAGSATTAQLAGTVAYGDGSGTFDAELEKVGDHWMLVNIQIKVDPDKLKAWQAKQG